MGNCAGKKNPGGLSDMEIEQYRKRQKASASRGISNTQNSKNVKTEIK